MDSILKHSTRRGISSSGKMSTMLDQCKKETLSYHDKKINLILKVAATIEYTMMESVNINAHIVNVSHSKFTSKNIDIAHKRCIQLANRELTLTNVFFDLMRELGEAIRNLIIGNYPSVPRSLRWIMESTIFWADMHDGNRTCVEALNDYSEQLAIASEKYDMLHEAIYMTNYYLLEQRLNLKEDWKKSFKDLLPNISFLKPEAKLFHPIKYFSFEAYIKNFYHDLSTYEHITFDTLSELDNDLRSDFALYMSYKFDNDKFHNTLSQIWEILDLILCIIILGCTKFYEYSSAYEYIMQIISFNGSDSETKKLMTMVKTQLQKMMPLSNLLNDIDNL